MKILDESESLAELLQCLTPITSLASHHESLFLSIFEDTADLIVGWLVDPTENIEYYTELTEITVEFQRFWVSNIVGSATYFDSFLKDLKDYTEDGKKQFLEFEGDPSIVEVEDTPILGTLKKIEFLLR